MWSKEDMKQYRKMIKEKKSFEDIKQHFGWEKLKQFPRGKYNECEYGGLPRFEQFVNEIYMTPREIDYITNISNSTIFIGYHNYNIFFKLNDNDYIMNYVFMKDKIGPFAGEDLYNISFTSKELYDEYLKTDSHEDYEKLSDKNEMIPLMKSLSYIILDHHKYLMKFHKKVIYVIGETEDERKINIYSDIIKNSFENVKEYYGVGSFNNGKNVYYYEIIEV